MRSDTIYQIYRFVTAEHKSAPTLRPTNRWSKRGQYRPAVHAAEGNIGSGSVHAADDTSKNPMKYVLMTALALTGGCVFVDDEPTENTAVVMFAQPLSTASDDDMESFAQGLNLFRKQWSPAVVGPIFNAPSCGECHVFEGRAAAESVGVLFRLSAADGNEDAIYGGQLQPRGLRLAPGEGSVVVRWSTLSGAYKDGEVFELRSPRYQLVDLNYGASTGMLVSPRVAQQLGGIGFLEALAQSDLVANEDPNDLDGDGISGRANWITSATTGGRTMGRFGWKAGQPSLREQNAAAFVGDMGITSAIFATGPCKPSQTACLDASFDDGIELDESDLEHVTRFTQLLAPPQVERSQGEELFDALKCSSCHVPTYVTGEHEISALSSQRISPYTDLLLHDMGPELADNRGEGLADGQEWRTPPLWGIGRVRQINGHLDLMHDGRARGVAEAILWHGGEAAASADAFRELSASDRARLITFVESI